MIKRVLLSFQLNIEIAVLLLSLSESGLLVIDFISEIGNEEQVSINAALVVIVHSAFVVI